MVGLANRLAPKEPLFSYTYPSMSDVFILIGASKCPRQEFQQKVGPWVLSGHHHHQRILAP